MQVILFIICAILFAELVLMIVAFSYLAVFTKGYKVDKSAPETSKVIEDAKMNEDALKEFLKADQEAAQGFHDAIANLNAFMTGVEEEDPNVGQQND